MPTVIGNTFAASLNTDISPQRKEDRPRLTLLHPFNLNFLIRLCGLKVRRWRLIGYFLSYINPPSHSLSLGPNVATHICGRLHSHAALDWETCAGFDTALS